MAKRLTPGTRVMIRSFVIDPWCQLGDDCGFASSKRCPVPDKTECIVFYDAGDSVGVIFMMDGQLTTGFFERQYVMVPA